MDTHVVDRAIAAWYDTIPGGRLTVFLSAVVCLALISIVGYFIHQRVLKFRELREQERVAAAKTNRNRSMHEAVGQVWHV